MFSIKFSNLSAGLIARDRPNSLLHNLSHYQFSQPCLAASIYSVSSDKRD